MTAVVVLALVLTLCFVRPAAAAPNAFTSMSRVAKSTFGQQARDVIGKMTVAATGLLLLCNTIACNNVRDTSSDRQTARQTTEQTLTSPELAQALHNDYHGKEVLFINDFGELAEGLAHKNSSADWFWVSIDNGGEVPIYEHEMVGMLAPDHEYVGTALLLPPLDGTGKNLLRNMRAIIDRVYVTNQLVVEGVYQHDAAGDNEGTWSKRSVARAIPTGYAITITAGVEHDGRSITFHTPFSLLITEGDIYNLE